MTNTFLEIQAKEIIESHGHELDQILIISPNKRAITYLNRHLAKMSSTPIFSPAIKTIYDWCVELSPFKLASKTELLFVLYDVHQAIEKEEAEDINSFLKWGSLLLSDFEEIDRYLIDHKVFFQDLKNIKEIENWSFGEENLSQGQENFISFWNKLPQYYTLLEEHLRKKGLTTMGRVYAVMLKEIDELHSGYKHIYFLGFNALSLVEERIIFGLVKRGKASVKFDMDAFYGKMSGHEANHFHHKLADKYHLKKEYTERFNEIPKEFTVIDTANDIQQVQVVSEILKAANTSEKEIAVVLADETLALPVLDNIPVNIGKVNMTIGFPIYHTSFGSLLEHVFELQFSFQKFSLGRLHYKTLLGLLDQPYLSRIITNAELRNFEHKLIEKNAVFIDFNDLLEAFPKLESLVVLLKPWSNIAKDGIEAARILLEEISKSLESVESDNKLEIETLRLFNKAVQDISDLVLNYDPRLDLKSFKRIFMNRLKEDDLAFYGNPVDGLQIMGILESRTLDFEHLIFVGLNEGNLPKTNIPQTFIPRDLRKVHGLPCEEDRQAIFAHHFYRLVQRAEKIDMIYTSPSENFSKSEKSRYIDQLANDLDLEKGHDWKEYSVKSEFLELNNGSGYQQNELSINRILNQLESGLSPSALNKFITCPLDFYYRYILGLKEKNEIEENIDASTFGTQIHEVLEVVFRDNFLEPKVALNCETLEEVRPQLEQLLRAAYEAENYSRSDLNSGKNKLSFEVSLKFLKRFFDQQMKEIKSSKEEIEILALEKELEHNMVFEHLGKEIKFKIKGTIDRIDRIGKVYRVIDYKSGTCSPDKINFIKKGSVESRLKNFLWHEKKGYGRQLLMYALMFRSSGYQADLFESGIIAMVNLNSWIFKIDDPYNKSTLISNETLDLFEEELIELMKTMLQEDFEFVHDRNAKYCSYCVS